MKARRAQRGFTLIELMVALAISSIMVLMVLAMFARITTAYRSQQQLTQLQVSLSAAQNLIEQEVKRAGFQLADGFHVAGFGNTFRAPIQITNSATGPDELRLYSADGARAARVLDVSSDDRIDVDDTAAFFAGDLAVMVNVGTTRITNLVQLSGGAAADTIVPTFEACLVRIERVDAGTPGTLRFDTTSPWGDADINKTGHCRFVTTQHAAETAPDTMIYGLHARAYRIDPTAARAALGVLQVSLSGGLIDNDWQDLGLGFTDLQLALRVFEENTTAGEPGATDTDDLDDLARYDWYSGEDMENVTGALFFRNNHPRITQVSVSLAARTDSDVDDVYTRRTPAFTDPARPYNNELGDRDSVDLTSSPPAALAGQRIYRYSINRIDARNTGSGL